MREWYQLMLCIAFSLSFSGLYLFSKTVLRRYEKDETEELLSTEQQMEQERVIEKKTDRRVAVMIFIVVLLVAGFLTLMIKRTISKGGV